MYSTSYKHWKYFEKKVFIITLNYFISHLRKHSWKCSGFKSKNILPNTIGSFIYKLFFLPLVIIVSLSTDRDVESPGRQSLGVSVRTFLDSLFAMSQSNCE